MVPVATVAGMAEAGLGAWAVKGRAGVAAAAAVVRAAAAASP